MAQLTSCTLRLWWGQRYATEEVGEEDYTLDAHLGQGIGDEGLAISNIA